jgi:hypothetical protein
MGQVEEISYANFKDRVAGEQGFDRSKCLRPCLVSAAQPSVRGFVNRSGRSYEKINDSTLQRLGSIARADRLQFLRTRPEFRGRLICVALCQGAGLHYVEVARGKTRPNGVKDFDVWSFFAAIPGQKFPAHRRNIHVDFGPSEFGRWPREPHRFRHFEGRRVDLFLRGIDSPVRGDPVAALQSWLSEARTGSQRALSAKGAVLIEPKRLRGTIAWPVL